jgi:hypothetical protein
MTYLIIINTLLFVFLSAIHVYWAVGGQRWKADVIPVRADGSAIFQPARAATLMVALGLLVFAIITLGNLGWHHKFVKQEYIRFATYGIAGIFFLRAIGDFRYIGFTKHIKGTVFSKRDSTIYSPLCLLLAVNSMAIAIFSK